MQTFFTIRRWYWHIVLEYVSRLLTAECRGIPTMVQAGSTYSHKIVVSHKGKCQGKDKGCIHPGHLKWQKKGWDHNDYTTWKAHLKKEDMHAVQRPGYPQSTAIRGVPLGRTPEERAAHRAAGRRRRQRNASPGEELQESDPCDATEEMRSDDSQADDIASPAQPRGDHARHFVDAHASPDYVTVPVVNKPLPQHVLGPQLPMLTVDQHETTMGYRSSSFYYLMKVRSKVRVHYNL